MPRNTLLRQLLEERHLTTYTAFEVQFSRAARSLAKEAGDPRLASVAVSSRQFDRWLSGELKQLPRPDTCRILEELLGRAARDLFASTSAFPPTAPEPLPADVPPSPQAGPTAHDDDPAEIVARARQLACGNVDQTTLSFLASRIEVITERYEKDGPDGLWGQTKSLRSMGHTLLAGQQPPSARRELFRVTARAGGLLGYMAVNTGAFPLAEAYCTEALELSRAIGDLDTEMWACGTQSFAAYYAGRYDEADARATAAVDRAPNHPQAIRLLVNGRARALGKLGDRNQAERAIGRALELSDRHDVAPGLTSCISFLPYGRARTLANALTARVALQDTRARAAGRRGPRRHGREVRLRVEPLTGPPGRGHRGASTASTRRGARHVPRATGHHSGQSVADQLGATTLSGPVRASSPLAVPAGGARVWRTAPRLGPSVPACRGGVITKEFAGCLGRRSSSAPIPQPSLPTRRPT
ncbi:tetratricopeptide repeat protein [Streptomyces althioticus]